MLHEWRLDDIIDSLVSDLTMLLSATLVMALSMISQFYPPGVGHLSKRDPAGDLKSENPSSQGCCVFILVTVLLEISLYTESSLVFIQVANSNLYQTSYLKKRIHMVSIINSTELIILEGLIYPDGNPVRLFECR